MNHVPQSESRLDEFLANPESGNRTAVEIAVPPATAWRALQDVGLADCRLTRSLLAIRALPGRLSGRGAYGSRQSVAFATDVPMLRSMTRDRFLVLHEEPGVELIVGVIGQFWKLAGGIDVKLSSPAHFIAFEDPGYVKVVANFRIEPTPTGSRVITETRNVASDPRTARVFARYWAAIGWGSKVIRWDILRAVRRRALARESKPGV